MVAARRLLRSFVFALFFSWPAAPSVAQTLTVDTAGDVLRIRATGSSILQGEPLTRLKDGRTVRVEFTAMVLSAPGGSAVATARRIYALSYDLWEERFAVTTIEKASRAASHLALPAVEAWCIEQLAFPMSALGSLRRDGSFWVRLEYRLLDAEGTGDQADSGYTLQALIDMLSRRRKTVASTQVIESGPFTLKSPDRARAPVGTWPF